MPIDLLTVPASRRRAIESFAHEFVEGRKVALSTHLNADGDGCGSESALATLLAAQGMAGCPLLVKSWLRALYQIKFDACLEQAQ